MVVKKTALISVDLSLAHGFNIDDLFADFDNTFPFFRNGNFKIGKIYEELNQYYEQEQIIIHKGILFSKAIGCDGGISLLNIMMIFYGILPLL